MKDKPNEWVAVADLMSGVVAVVMLLFIVSVLQQAAYKVKTQEELKKYKELILVSDNFSKNNVETQAQNELDRIFKAKMSLVEKGISVVMKYQHSLLTVECIAFDCCVMIRRSNNGFKNLNNILFT